MKSVEFVCRRCQAQLVSAPEERPGAVVQCPSCGADVRIPTQARRIAAGAGRVLGILLGLMLLPFGALFVIVNVRNVNGTVGGIASLGLCGLGLGVLYWAFRLIKGS